MAELDSEELHLLHRCKCPLLRFLTPEISVSLSTETVDYRDYRIFKAVLPNSLSPLSLFPLK